MCAYIDVLFATPILVVFYKGYTLVTRGRKYKFPP